MGHDSAIVSVPSHRCTALGREVTIHVLLGFQDSFFKHFRLECYWSPTHLYPVFHSGKFTLVSLPSSNILIDLTTVKDPDPGHVFVGAVGSQSGTTSRLQVYLGN